MGVDDTFLYAARIFQTYCSLDFMQLSILMPRINQRRQMKQSDVGQTADVTSGKRQMNPSIGFPKTLHVDLLL